jgi:lipoprotein-anchoring transpeptidase ErfK/SrfK
VSRGSAAALAAALALALALCVVGPAGAAHATPTAPTRTEAWIARVVYPTVARTRPGGGAIVTTVAAKARWDGGPVGLLVLATQRDRHGRLWLRVRLPMRPNRTSGWILADFTKLRPTPYRIEVSVRRRAVRLLDRGRVIRSYHAVVGRPYWPTPRGLFAVSERVPQPDPHGFLGPWALLLTAFSPTLTRFGGGPGQVALHGRDGASLADPLGSARSHGCIRIPNVAIRLLARVAREGTPVEIVA